MQGSGERWRIVCPEGLSCLFFRYSQSGCECLHLKGTSTQILGRAIPHKYSIHRDGIDENGAMGEPPSEGSASTTKIGAMNAAELGEE